MVKDGAIGLFRNIDNEQILVDICDEGDIFGLRPLLAQENYIMEARAYEETILYAKISEMANEHPPFEFSIGNPSTTYKGELS